MAFFNSLNAQSIITGKVTNPDGKPLIGANITARQALSAAITSHDGMFKIVAEPTDTLLISYVGYARVMFAIGGQREISIVMVPSRELLQQVVVIGYGIQKKEDITGAISSVDASDFNGGIVNSPEQLFRGKVAGVELTQNDGEPGAAFTVRIRGNSTIRAGNDPLYVVDGYPVDINNPLPLVDGPNRPFKKNPLEFLNPQDIASISILKDASATAIYGARGANGVVIITTKTGELGRPQLSYSTYLGVSRLRRKIAVLSPDAFRTALGDFGLGNNDFGASTDCQDAVYQSALVQNHNLALAGGVTNMRYRASVNFHDQQGLIRTTGYKKYSARIQLQQAAINDRLQLEVNLTAAQVRDRRAPRGVVIGTLSHNPTWPVRNEAGDFFQPQPGINHSLAFLGLSSDDINTTRLLGNLWRVQSNQMITYLF